MALPGIWISLGQTFQQAWHEVQVKSPVFTASVTRSQESLGSMHEAGFLPHGGGAGELYHLQGRADRDAGHALDTAPQRFEFLHLFHGGHAELRTRYQPGKGL